MRARTVFAAAICLLFAASATVEDSVLAATRKQPQTRRPTKAVGRAKVPAKPARRPVSHHELNTFLRSPAGKAKLKVYKQQAFDVPRMVAHPNGEKPFMSLGAKHKAFKRSGRLVKIFAYAGSVVTGAMGGMFGGFIGMMTGGMPTGPEMLQHPGTHPAMHFFSQGHVLVGAIIGAGGAIAVGTAVAMGFKRAAKKVDRQAHEEAVARILDELETGMESHPPTPHPLASTNMPGGGRGQQRDILNDLWGGPGSLFGPQQSAADRGAHTGISDVGPSGGFDFGPPGGPP